MRPYGAAVAGAAGHYGLSASAMLLRQLLLEQAEAVLLLEQAGSRKAQARSADLHKVALLCRRAPPDLMSQMLRVLEGASSTGTPCHVQGSGSPAAAPAAAAAATSSSSSSRQLGMRAMHTHRYCICVAACKADHRGPHPQQAYAFELCAAHEQGACAGHRHRLGAVASTAVDVPSGAYGGEHVLAGPEAGARWIIHLTPSQAHPSNHGEGRRKSVFPDLKAPLPLLQVSVLSGFEATDHAAAERVAASCRLLINCLRYTPEPYHVLLQACMKHRTQYIDINGDPAWVDAVVSGAALVAQPSAASQAHEEPGQRQLGQELCGEGTSPGAHGHAHGEPMYAVPGCGFDYLLPVLGALHAARALPPGAALHSLRAVLQVVLGPQGVVLRTKTWEEAVMALHGSRTPHKLQPPRPVPPGDVSGMRGAGPAGSFPLARGVLAWQRNVVGAMMGASRALLAVPQHALRACVYLLRLYTQALWAVLSAAAGAVRLTMRLGPKAVLSHAAEALKRLQGHASDRMPLQYSAPVGRWAVRALGTTLNERLISAGLHTHLQDIVQYSAARPDAGAAPGADAQAAAAEPLRVSCRLALTPSLVTMLTVAACMLLAAAMAQLAASRAALLRVGPWLARRLMGVEITPDDARALQAMDGMSFLQRYELDFALPAHAEVGTGAAVRERWVEKEALVAGAGEEGRVECASAGPPAARPCAAPARALRCGRLVVCVEGMPGCMRDVTAACMVAAALHMMRAQARGAAEPRAAAAAVAGAPLPLPLPLPGLQPGASVSSKPRAGMALPPAGPEAGMGPRGDPRLLVAAETRLASSSEEARGTGGTGTRMLVDAGRGGGAGSAAHVLRGAGPGEVFGGSEQTWRFLASTGLFVTSTALSVSD